MEKSDSIFDVPEKLVVKTPKNNIRGANRFIKGF